MASKNKQQFEKLSPITREEAVVLVEATERSVVEEGVILEGGVEEADVLTTTTVVNMEKTNRKIGLSLAYLVMALVATELSLPEEVVTFTSRRNRSYRRGFDIRKMGTSFLSGDNDVDGQLYELLTFSGGEAYVAAYDEKGEPNDALLEEWIAEQNKESYLLDDDELITIFYNKKDPKAFIDHALLGLKNNNIALWRQKEAEVKEFLVSGAKIV